MSRFPAHFVKSRALRGSPHVAYALFVGGVKVREQLHPFSEEEIAGHVRAFVSPPPLPPMRSFDVRAKPGPKPKGASKFRGAAPAWSDNDE